MGFPPQLHRKAVGGRFEVVKSYGKTFLRQQLFCSHGIFRLPVAWRNEVCGVLLQVLGDVELDVGGDVLTDRTEGQTKAETEGKRVPCSWFGTNLRNVEPGRETAQVVEQLFPEVDEMKSHAV